METLALIGSGIASAYSAIGGASTLAAVAGGVGTVLTAVGQARQGQVSGAISDANAQIATENAKMRQQAAKEDAYKISQERRRLIGKQATLFGAAGVDIGTGSPLDVMAETAAQYERDIGYSNIKADQAMLAGENEAEIERYQAKQQRAAGWLGAGTSLLTGAGNLYYRSKWGRT